MMALIFVQELVGWRLRLERVRGVKTVSGQAAVEFISS